MSQIYSNVDDRSLNLDSNDNLGYTLEETCSILQEKFGIRPQIDTLSGWYEPGGMKNSNRCAGMSA